MAQATLPGLESQTYKVLFVCTGNICRSPTAEAVFRHVVTAAGLADRIGIDSAGTHGYHVGEPPDPRSVSAGLARGFDLKTLRARKVRAEDFRVFDLILAMDQDHHDHLEALKPNDARAAVKLFLDYHPKLRGGDVPDPYYGGPGGFTRVLDMIEEASAQLLAEIEGALAQR
jgi:protein-tyrosine phosphatase